MTYVVTWFSRTYVQMWCYSEIGFEGQVDRCSFLPNSGCDSSVNSTIPARWGMFILCSPFSWNTRPTSAHVPASLLSVIQSWITAVVFRRAHSDVSISRRWSGCWLSREPAGGTGDSVEPFKSGALRDAGWAGHTEEGKGFKESACNACDMWCAKWCIWILKFIPQSSSWLRGVFVVKDVFLVGRRLPPNCDVLKVYPCVMGDYTFDLPVSNMIRRELNYWPGRWEQSSGKQTSALTIHSVCPSPPWQISACSLWNLLPPAREKRSDSYKQSFYSSSRQRT